MKLDDRKILLKIMDTCAFPERLLRQDEYGFWNITAWDSYPDDVVAIQICPAKGPILYRDGHSPETLPLPLAPGSKKRLRSVFGLVT